jgi:hypothetical protein
MIFLVSATGGGGFLVLDDSALRLAVLLALACASLHAKPQPHLHDLLGFCNGWRWFFGAGRLCFAAGCIAGSGLRKGQGSIDH